MGEQRLSQSEKPNKDYTFSWLPRGRWNVLDLIDFGRKSVPTYLFCDIDMTWAEQLRKRLMDIGHRTTITAILLKAIGIAQKHHPASRSALLPWGQIVTFHRIIAGFTVERYVECGPVVFFGSINDPDRKSVEQIAAELRDYAEKDINEIPQLDLEHRFSKMPWLFRKFVFWLGKRFPSIRLKCQGATFGFSTLGKYKLRSIIPPNVCTSVFGVGTVEPRPVVNNNQIEIRSMMTLTLNFDHRLIDGAPAARFLNDVRTLLEGGLARYLDDQDLTNGIRLVEPLKSPIMSQEGEVLSF